MSEQSSAREWILAKAPREKMQALREAFHYPDFILSILVNRGIDTPEKVMDYTRPSMLSLLTPFLFRDMEKAVERIVKAVENSEAILIFGDKDVDGVSATAILHRFLQKAGANVVYRVPEKSESYGISRDTIRWAVASELYLVITVDCGITSVEEAVYAKSVGVDLIITDHHDLRDVVPDAFAVMNPKVKADGYPYPYLCGAAVAFKLVWALAERLWMDDLYNKTAVFFDLETTGLDPGRDDIIEIGAVKTRNGVVLGEFQRLVKIGRPVPPDATAINGITDAMLEAEGIPIEQALREFLDFIGDAKLVGHNIVDFDMKFIAHWMKKVLDVTVTNPVEDTLRMARVMIRKIKDHKLITVAAYLGLYVDETTLHRAVQDCRVTAEVYRRMLIGRNPKMQDTWNEYLPLAALGTVADIMPLSGENRIIVKNGLRLVPYSSIGLLSIIRANNLNPERLQTRDISWYIAPLLNSPGRVGDASLSVDILVSGKLKEVEELIGEIQDKDSERRNIVDDGLEIVNAAIDTLDRTKDKVFLVASEKISKGTTGLIANRVAYQLLMPTLILTIDGENATGSIRGANFDVGRILDYAADIFLQFGGHKFAGGFTLKTADIRKLRDRCNEYMDKGQFDSGPEEIRIDTTLDDLSELNMNAMHYLENIFEPTGNQNEFPRFLVSGVKIASFRTISKTNAHALMSISKNGREIGVIGWNLAAKLKAMFESYPVASRTFDIVAFPEINKYQGSEEIRLNLVDIRPR
jgi:single-stranded-DNA-specific exonuclease